MIRRKPRSTLCIDISLGRLSVIEVQNGSVLRWASRPFDAQLVHNGDPLEPEHLGAMLRQIIHGAGMRAGRARLALPDEAAVIRILEVPRMPKRHLAGAMKFLAEKELPFPIGRARSSWDLAGENGAGLLVCVAAAWRDVVDRLVDVCRIAGLTVEAVEPHSLSVARALAGEDALVLDVASNQCQLTLLLSEQVPYVDRLTLPIDRAARAESVARLMEKARRHEAEVKPGGVRAPVLLAGEIEGQNADWQVPVRNASFVLNGHKPTRPPQFPGGGFLSNLGLAMR